MVSGKSARRMNPTRMSICITGGIDILSEMRKLKIKQVICVSFSNKRPVLSSLQVLKIVGYFFTFVHDKALSVAFIVGANYVGVGKELKRCFFAA